MPREGEALLGSARAKGYLKGSSLWGVHVHVHVCMYVLQTFLLFVRRTISHSNQPHLYLCHKWMSQS
jgi:hypothetical protein